MSDVSAAVRETGPLVPPAPPPAPEGISALQAARRIRSNPLTLWSARAYEEEVLERPFFGRRSFLLNAPDAIRHVLVEHVEAFTRPNASIRLLAPMLGNGLLLSEGAEWRLQRRTMAPAFTPKAVGLLVPHMRAATEQAIDSLAVAASGPVDLFAALQRLTLEIAGRTMFSVEMDRKGGALRDFVARYARRLARQHFFDLVLPLSIPSPHDFARRRFRPKWQAFVSGIIEDRLRLGSQPGAPRDLFDLLLEARDPDTGQGFTSDELRDQVATLILAGHETTAVALFWSAYLLALSPEHQARVAEEVSADPDTDAMGRGLAYTRAVLDEAMRLYPPVYIIARKARQEARIGELRLDAGDLAVVSPWVLHRHRRRWRDPDVFAPERFLPGNPPPDRFSYLPFGLGPRICIGAQFALTEATLVLAALVRRFRVELVDGKRVMPVAVVTTQPDHSPRFRLRLR